MSEAAHEPSAHEPSAHEPSAQPATSRLTATQSAMLFEQIADPTSIGNNLVASVLAPSSATVDQVRTAWVEALNRHPVLTSKVVPTDSGYVLESVPGLMSVDVAATDDVTLSAVRDELARRVLRPFDLFDGPLLHASARCDGTQVVAVLSTHHVLADVVSAQLAINEFFARLRLIEFGTPVPELPPGVDFDEHVDAEIRYLASPEADRDREYWRQHLAGYERDPLAGLAALPTRTTPEPGSDSGQEAWVRVEAEPDAAASIRAHAKAQGVSAAVLLLTAYLRALRAVSAEPGEPADLAVALPVLRRGKEHLFTLGSFTQLAVVRARVGAEFDADLAPVAAALAGAREHGALPTAEIARYAADPAAVTRTTFLYEPSYLGFGTAFVLGDHYVLDLSGYKTVPYPLPEWMGQFPVRLQAGMINGRYVCAVHFADHYEPAAHRVAIAFRDELRALVRRTGEGNVPTSDVAIVGPDELGSGWVHPARGRAAAPADVLDRIADAVADHPDRLAVSSSGNGTAFNYRQLWHEAGRVAQLVGPTSGELVGIMMPKGPAAVAAIVGVLRSGNPFVVIDPTYPADRRAVMLDGLSRLVVDADTSATVPDSFTGTVLHHPLDAGSAPDLPHHRGATAALSAYAVFTSGSTGRPKRVLVGRPALARSTAARDELYGAPVGRFLHLSSLSFDSAYAGLFWTLATGGELVLVDMAAAPSTAELGSLIRDRQVTHLLAIPSLYEALLADEAGQLGSLRDVVVAGEECGRAVRTRHAEVLPQTRLTNEYGPSEAVVWATAAHLDGDGSTVPIGRGISGITVDVVDSNGAPVPPGTVGELALTGTLADGYVGDPRATAAAFRPDPQSTTGGRVYATGDIATIGLDGNAYFHGRNDHQVKIAGHRVELAEVEEAVRARVPGRCVALGRAGAGGRRELALVVERAGPDREFDVPALREELGRALPAYMVPRVVETVAELPVNANGKVDRPALEALLADRTRAATAQADTEPTRTEQPTHTDGTPAHTVVDAIANGLGIRAAEVDPQRSFVELGGDSIGAMRVVGYLHRRGLRLTPRAVLGERRVGDLVDQVSVEPTADRPVDPTPEGGPVTGSGIQTSAAQRAMLLQSFAEPGSGIYVEQLVLDLAGDVDPGRLCAAFRRTFETYPVLTAAPGPAPHAVLLPTGPDAVEIDIADRPLTGPAWDRWCADDRRRGFGPGGSPLSRVTVAPTATGGVRCVWTHHHALADGWSLPVIIGAVAAAYRGERLPAPQAPPAVPATAVTAAQDPLPQLLDGVPVAGSERRADPAGRSIEVDLPTDLSAAAERLGVTIAAVLNTAWALTLGGAFDAADVGHGMVSSGRDVSADGADRAVGMFIRIDPIRTSWAEGEGVHAVARRVADRMADVLDAPAPASWAPESIVVVENYPLDPVALSFGDAVTVTGADLLERTEFPLTVQFRTYPAASCALHVDPARISAALARRLADRLGAVLAVLTTVRAGDPVTRALTASTGNPPAEAREAAAAADPAPAGLVERVAEHARLRPDALAVVTPNARITYAELDRRRRELTAGLRCAGVRPGEVVAVRARQDAPLAPVLLALRSAGAAWTVLDADLPAERVAAVLTRSAAAWQATCDGLRVRIERTGPAESMNGGLDGIPASANQTAYLIFTSGTTGEPKCIAVSETAFVAHLTGICRRFGYTADDTIMVFGSLAFDASIEQLFGGLSVGATTVTRPRDTLAPKEVADLLRTEAVTVFNPPTGYWNQFVSASAELPESLRAVVVGGEALPARAVVDGPQVWNAYGPTEAVVTALAHPVLPGTPDPVPVGSPGADRGVLVVGDGGRPVERGIAGEICLTGPLADGYLADARGTADAFRPDPGAGETAPPGSRMYRSGDLGVMAEDGTVDYAGRLDRQLKVRGHRVDPAEMEAVAAALPGVRDARAVLVSRSPGAQARLECVVVADPAAPAPPDGAVVRAAMAERLPATLLPARVHVAEVLPLTRTGKVDDDELRRRISRDGHDREWTPGAGRRDGADIDGVVRAAVRSVLGEIPPGVGFLAAGGDSLRVLELCAIARRDGVVLDPAVALADGTVADLIAAAVVDPAATAVGHQPLRSDRLPPAVHWFRDRVSRTPAATWNMAIRVDIDGLLGGDDLDRAVREVLRVHPMLRAQLVPAPDERGDGLELQIGDSGPTLMCFDALHATAEHAQRRMFNALSARVRMDTGTPIGFGAVRIVDRSSTVVIVVAHHFVMDVVSLQIVAGDLGEAIERADEPDFRLPAERTSVHEWVTWLEAQAREPGALDRCRAAYRGVAAPAGTPDAGCERDAVTVRRALPAAVVRRGCAALRAEVEELLQAAAATAHATLSGTGRTVLEVETHGRALYSEGIDLGRTVGWFTGLAPVPVHVAPLPVQIAEIRGRRAYLGQEGQAVAALRHLVGVDPAPQMVPAVGVNYVGRIDAAAGSAVQPYGAGRLRSPHLARPVAVQVDAWFRDDELVVSVEAGAAAADRFAEAMASALASAESSGPVPVRAGCAPADLGGNDLQDLVAEFGELAALAPLTSVQEGMYLRSQSDGPDAAYVEQLALGLPTDVDVETLRAALESAVAVDPLLRGRIAWQGLTEPVLVTPHDAGQVVRTARVEPEQLRRFAADEVAAVAAGPALARAVIVEGADPVLVLTVHHLAADGWSMRELLHRADVAYSAPERPAGTTVDLRAIEHMVVATTARRSEPPAEIDRAPAVLFPAVVSNAEPTGSGNVDLTVLLDPEQARAVRRGAARHGVTLAALAHAAWALVLGEPGAAADRPDRVRFGSIGQHRPPGYEDAAGMFIEAQAIHADVTADSDVAELVAAVHAVLQGGRRGAVTSSAGDSYETAVIVDDARGVGSAAAFLGRPVDVRWSRERTGLALTVSVIDLGPDDGIEITLNCDTARVDIGTGQHVVDRCAEVLVGIGQRGATVVDLWRSAAPIPKPIPNQEALR